MKRLLFILFLQVWICLMPLSSAAEDRFIQFKVPVIADVKRYEGILATPAYAALALENNGLGVSLSSKMSIQGRDAFKIKTGTISFLGRKGSLFQYKASARLFNGVNPSEIAVPFEIDLSNMDEGFLLVRAYPPLPKLIPKELIDRIEFKIRSLADVYTQRQLVTYLDELAKDANVKRNGFEGLLEQIAFDAYNKTTGVAVGTRVDDVGRAEVISDQWMLILAACLWIIGIPLFLWIVRQRRKMVRGLVDDQPLSTAS